MLPSENEPPRHGQMPFVHAWTDLPWCYLAAAVKTPRGFLYGCTWRNQKTKSKLVLVFTCVITALATCLMVMPIDLIKLLDCQNGFGHALPWIRGMIPFTFSMYWNMEGN